MVACARPEPHLRTLRSEEPYKHELIYKKGPWTSTNAVEIATAEWVHWYNNRRLHSALDYRTPAAVETDYWTQHTVPEPALQNN